MLRSRRRSPRPRLRPTHPRLRGRRRAKLAPATATHTSADSESASEPNKRANGGALAPSPAALTVSLYLEHVLSSRGDCPGRHLLRRPVLECTFHRPRFQGQPNPIACPQLCDGLPVAPILPRSHRPERTQKYQRQETQRCMHPVIKSHIEIHLPRGHHIMHSSRINLSSPPARGPICENSVARPAQRPAAGRPVWARALRPGIGSVLSGCGAVSEHAGNHPGGRIGKRCATRQELRPRMLILHHARHYPRRHVDVRSVAGTRRISCPLA